MADQFITDLSKFSKETQDLLAQNARTYGGKALTAAEYLAERGGINPVTRKFGDSYNPNVDLNDAEYQAAIAGAGTKVGDKGAAINAATKAKITAYIKANPNASAEEIQKAISYGVLKSEEYGTDSDGNIIGAIPESNVKKTVSSVTKQSDGSSIVTYSDGTKVTLPAGSAVPAVGSSTTTTGNTTTSAAMEERQSAYDLLYSQFKQYGLESLVEPLKGLIVTGASPAEFTIKLRESDSYKKRFSANAQRVAKGLRSLSEAEYIQLEDQYQDVMRRYGLPDTYYARGEMGIQEGFNKFLEGDVSPVELEDRISTAQKRVLNANPEVIASLKEFYPDISNADILAYTLDPKNAIENIKRKVTAAEIGGAATQAGLKTGMTRAEELAAAGVTKDVAQQGFRTIAEVAPRGGQLAEIYKQNPYTQATAETEVFGLGGAVDAAKQRKKLTQLETAAFSGSAGTGAIARDRAGVL